jgi:hypothetical protein
MPAELLKLLHCSLSFHGRRHSAQGLSLYGRGINLCSLHCRLVKVKHSAVIGWNKLSFLCVPGLNCQGKDSFQPIAAPYFTLIIQSRHGISSDDVNSVNDSGWPLPPIFSFFLFYPLPHYTCYEISRDDRCKCVGLIDRVMHAFIGQHCASSGIACARWSVLVSNSLK